ncbi:DUF6302 family protein [Streptomyces sp. NPDC093252]|uniref:DUF6302 family protein n=1 Tax=Streptomyces sp. NPDC093252 TaxID=3154980 RepID=UPI0034417626
MTASFPAGPGGSAALRRGGSGRVTVEAPQVAAVYGPTSTHGLADSALLSGAVTLRLGGLPEGDGAGGGGELLAVPSGPGRLGGFLPVPDSFAAEVADVLGSLPGFDGVRLEADGRGRLLVVWGAVCPARISAPGRRRFYGVAGSIGGLELRDAVMLDALAHGTPVAAFAVCRLATEREVFERMEAAGEVLAGWRGMTWTAIVHEAVCQGVVPVWPSQPAGLSPLGLGLLDAWAAGVPWGRVADLLGVTAPGALRELEDTVCRRLGAHSALHAVLRGHETGLLHARRTATAATAAGARALGRGP